MKDKMQNLYYDFEQNNSSLDLMNYRLGNVGKPHYKFDTVKGAQFMGSRLRSNGGFAQQDRMIRDKQKSLDKATLYSYQGAWVKLYQNPDEPRMDFDDNTEVRALINPNKLKQDYDDKIISIQFEHNFHTGDVFEWCNTGTYWLIYLQDLTELAYFRAEIRKCSYELSWLDENGNKRKTHIALRGPVETKIDYIQKHQISVDNPNFSLNFLLPKNEHTLKYFKRYSKFYLSGLHEGQDNTCWRVEAIDAYSMPGIIEINAVEYYANEFEDDLEQGLVGALVAKPIDPPIIDSAFQIWGESFIKPKREYTYYIEGSLEGYDWYLNQKLPLNLKKYIDEQGCNSVKIKWQSSYSGQFELIYSNQQDNSLPVYKKTIVVESLF